MAGLNDLLDSNILSEPVRRHPDGEAALWHAEERARLTAQGRTPSYVDGQIAAIAKTNDLTLVTRNTSDFVRFRRPESRELVRVIVGDGRKGRRWLRKSVSRTAKELPSPPRCLKSLPS